jgi:hypothetical protein
VPRLSAGWLWNVVGSAAQPHANGHCYAYTPAHGNFHRHTYPFPDQHPDSDTYPNQDAYPSFSDLQPGFLV